jgi:plastocyanin
MTSFRMRVLAWFCVLALALGASTIFSGVARAQKSAPQTHTVVIHNFAFQPQEITVHVGDTIVWKNTDIVSHTVTAADGLFDSGEIKPGKSWRFVAKKAGTFQYSCSPHPNMRGTLTVK